MSIKIDKYYGITVQCQMTYFMIGMSSAMVRVRTNHS